MFLFLEFSRLGINLQLIVVVIRQLIDDSILLLSKYYFVDINKVLNIDNKSYWTDFFIFRQKKNRFFLMKEKNGQRKFEGCQLIDSEVCIIQSSKQVKSINLYICLSIF